MLAIRPLRYPAPRGLLAPLLDAAWPGADAVALRSARRRTLSQLLAATAERQADAATAALADAGHHAEQRRDRRPAGRN